MRGELRDLFTRPVARALFIAAACGSAAASLVHDVVHGFVTTPLAFPAKPDLSTFAVIEALGYDTLGAAVVAGRSVQWLEPLSAAVVLALVAGFALWLLRATQ